MNQIGLQVVEYVPAVERADRSRDDLTFWWSPEIARLQRERRFAEALAVAWSGMEAVECVRPLPYGWAWGVAVIARQLHRHDLEVEVIERVLAIAAEGGTPAELWDSRLPAAKALASQGVGRERNQLDAERSVDRLPRRPHHRMERDHQDAGRPPAG